MRTVSAMDLRRKLGEILDAASAGERILIERDHHPLAVLMSVEDAERIDEQEIDRRQRALEASRRLDEFAKEMAAKYGRPGDADAATLIRHERSRDDPDFDPDAIQPPYRRSGE